jgi:hypothetical protein
MYTREDNMGRRGFTEVGTYRPVNGGSFVPRLSLCPILNDHYGIQGYITWGPRFAVATQQVASSGEVSGLYSSEDVVFESWAGHRLSWLQTIRSFPQPFPCKCRDGTSIRQRPLPFQSFAVHPIIRCLIFCTLTSSWSDSLRSRR